MLFLVFINIELVTLQILNKDVLKIGPKIFEQREAKRQKLNVDYAFCLVQKVIAKQKFLEIFHFRNIYFL